MAGLLLQLLCEGIVTARGRSAGRPWIGLVFTLARCGQVLLLAQSNLTGGACAAALAVAWVLWPVNAVVLCVLLLGRWRVAAAVA